MNGMIILKKDKKQKNKKKTTRAMFTITVKIVKN